VVGLTKKKENKKKKKEEPPGIAFDVDRDLNFNLDRPLFFESERGEVLTGRKYTFERWRRLDFREEEGVIAGDRLEKAKELNVKAVQFYKEGKYKEAMWFVDKALALSPHYEKAVKNRETLMKKLAEQRSMKDGKTKKTSQDAVSWSEEPAYQQQSHTQQQSYTWSREYRCPNCGIPVRQHWILCTNCGTDLRRYPPVLY
jgi:hypothetical protein